MKLAKGRATKARQGEKPTGVAPYGYMYSADKKHIIVHPTEAEVIKRIFKMAQHGDSLNRIADTLNSEGILTRRNKQWTRATLHKMLHNDFYVGIVTYRNQKIDGKHPAIISKVQFGKVKKQLARKDKLKQIGKG